MLEKFQIIVGSVVIASASAIAQTTSAQPPIQYTDASCSQSKTNQDTLKALSGVAGGIAGGLFGKKTSKKKKEIGEIGTVLGAVGGAVIASELVEHFSQCDQELASKASSASLETGQDQTFYNAKTGTTATYSVQPETVQVAEKPGELCREQKTKVKLGDDAPSPQRSANPFSSTPKVMCKGADGVWRPA